MKRSIRALALVCAAVLSLLCFAACGGDPATDPEEAVTLDATPFLDGYHLDFDAYLKTQGLSYAGIWSLPTVLPSYRSNAVCDTLTGAATVHWDLVSDTEFANVREYYECELQYYFDYYTTMYANYGLAFEYATAEAFAPDLFGYDKATYPTFRDFADAQTKDRFGKMLVMQAFCLAAGILPTEEEVDDYYNTYITRIALSSGASVAQIEAQYADECGEHFLPFTMRQNQLIELTEAYAEEHWTFDVPEVTEADKTAIDPAEYRETATATDLVKMHIHSGDGSVDGDVYIRLYPEYAPITVANFRQLVADGFYNGLTFHRSQRGFCLQGGDPNGNGSGGSSRTIKGEFVENGVGNPLSHLSGVVSMARANAYDSASSQFFFTMSDNYQSSLDGKYAAFGYVVSGWDVVTAAHALPVDTANNNKPLTTITMTNVTFAEKIPE